MKENDQAVQDVVGALKAGVDAMAVALFDDDRVRIHASSETPPDAFWNIFGGITCLEVDWGTWYRELRATRQHKATCSCGERHRLYGLVIRERWILLIVAPGEPVPGIESVFSSAASVLMKLLPSHRARARSRGPTGGSGPAQLGIPLWWRRKVEE